MRIGQHRPRYTIVEQSNHWKIQDGRYYRQSVIRRANGVLRSAYVLDGTVGGAA